jgi:hypothetical protein
MAYRIENRKRNALFHREIEVIKQWSYSEKYYKINVTEFT